jgi:hypothetical protein
MARKLKKQHVDRFQGKERQPAKLPGGLGPRLDSIATVAYIEQCTSPKGVRQFKHRTDVLNGDHAGAQKRSEAFRRKYEQQGWTVRVNAVFS